MPPSHFSPAQNSPAIPHPPHTTPAEYSLRAPRPPIHNPYDKFTQPEFDAWIGGITGALRRALGQVDDADTELRDTVESSPEHDVSRDEEDEDEEMMPEDSFAEHLARKRAKGKARDPREGPGLIGQGDKDQPFELLSDDDEEEEEEEVGQKPHMEYDDDDEEEEGEEEDKEHDEDEQVEWDDEAHSDDVSDEEQYKQHPLKLKKQVQKQPSPEYDTNEERSSTPRRASSQVEEASHRALSEVIELLDSDEDEEPQQQDSDDKVHYSEYDQEEDEDEGEEEEEEPEPVQPVRMRRRPNHAPTPELRSPSPSYSNEESDELDHEEDEIQPMDDDTSFPPQKTKRQTSVDIPDPWEGAQTYAEDLYTGGDKPVLHAREKCVDPDHLEDAYEGFLTPDVVPTPRLDGEDDIFEGDTPWESTPPRVADEDLDLDQLYDDINADILAMDNSPLETDEVISDLVDWNHPSAFPQGVPATAPGRLDPESSLRGSSEVVGGNSEQDEELPAGAFPLGTSDLGGEEGDDEEEYHSSPPQERYFRVPISGPSDDDDEEDDEITEIMMPSEVIEPESEEEKKRGGSGETEEIVLEEGEGVMELGFIEKDEKAPAKGKAKEDVGEHALGSIAEASESTLEEDIKGMEAEMDAELRRIEEIIDNVDGGKDKNVAAANSALEENIKDMETTLNQLKEVVDLVREEEGAGTGTALDALDAGIRVRPVDVQTEEEAEASAQVQDEEATMDEDIQEVQAGPSTSIEAAPPAPPPVPVSVPLSAILPQAQVYPGIEQLPTPPSEPQTPPLSVEKERHRTVEVEEVLDEDATPPPELQPQQQETPATQVELDIPMEKSTTESAEVTEEQGYTVVEAKSESEDVKSVTDEDADGEADIDVEIISVASSSSMHMDNMDEGYTVEEPLTEGRLTTEPTSERAQSVDAAQEVSTPVIEEPESPEIVQPEVKKSSDFLTVPRVTPPREMPGSPMHGSNYTFDIQAPSPMNMEFSPYDEEEEEHRAQEVGREAPVIKADVPAKEAEERSKTETTSQQEAAGPSTSRLEGNVPMPVSADANVPDPVDSPVRRRKDPSLIVSLPGTPSFMLSPAGTPGTAPVPVSIPVPQSILQALRRYGSQSYAEAGPSGLFTPKDGSGAATPELQPEVSSEPQILLEIPTAEAEAEAEAPSTPTEKPLRETVETSDAEISARDTSEIVTTAHELAKTLVPETPHQPTHPMGVPLTRRPSQTILVADPYPISLSTPGASFGSSSKDDEWEEMENSTSSSSTGLEKDQESRREEIDEEELEFQYPTEDEIHEIAPPTAPTEASTIAPPPEESAAPSTEDIHEGGDMDADGELDPEFLGSGMSAGVPSPRKPARHTQLPAAVLEEKDPFKLMGNDSAVAPGPAEESSSSSEDKSSEEPTPVVEKSESPEKAGEEPTPVAEKSEPTLPIQSVEEEKLSETKVDGGVDISIQQQPAVPTEPDVFIQTSQSEKIKQDETKSIEFYACDAQEKATARPKRKRGVSAEPSTSGPDASSTSTPATGSSAEKKGRKGRTSTGRSKRKSKSNGKTVIGDTIHVRPRAKDKEDRAPSEKPSEASVGSSSSGASAAAKLLELPSRASSIASTAPSERSLPARPSPTTQRSSSFIPPPPPMPSLFHAHGQARNMYTNAPPLTVQQQIRQFQRAPTQVSVGEQPSRGPLVSPIASSPTQTATPTPTPASPAAVPQRSQPTTSPLVTRSHCKYHKISLPKEEGGTRVCFMVPGCSLSDRKLMAEEEIEDHGDATQADIDNAVGDVETLDFEEYLFWTLRQLVGIDIMHRQEVYYLPSPGEEVQRKPRKAERAGSLHVLGSPSLSMYARSPGSWKAPGSVAGSAGTATSRLRKALGSEKGSMSFTDTESIASIDYDDELPKSKRARPSPPDDKTETGAMGPPSQSRATSKLKSRKAKRLGVDALAYQPENDVSEESGGEDGESKRKKKSKSSKRGIKRARTSEVAPSGDGDSRAMKKLKPYATMSAIPPSKVGPQNSATSRNAPPHDNTPIPDTRSLENTVTGDKAPGQ